MRIPWKLLGVAGLAGVAASGAVVVRRRRAYVEPPPEVLRDRLRDRLAQAQPPPGGSPAQPGHS